ncbi:flippase [Streptococcus cameli]
MKKKSLKINALLNLTRQAMTIVFPFMTFPYVSRILGSEEFGKYNFSTSLVSYFALLAIFGVTNYAVREGARVREDKLAFTNLASQLFSFNVLTTGISYAFLFLILGLSKGLNTYIILVAVHSLSILLTTIGLDWVNTVYEDYLYITIRYILIQILALIAIFVFVKNPDDTIKYCIIMVLGSYGGNLVNLFYIRKYVKVRFTLAIPFKKFILPMAILFVNSLAVIIYVNSDITILGILKTDVDVGQYSFASKIYNILKMLINSAVVVAVPRLTTLLVQNKAKYKSHIQTILNSLVLVLIPIAVGMMILSESIILIVGGKEYLAGDMALKILSFSLIFALLASIYTNCMLIIGRQERKILIGTSISATINVVGNFILIPFIGIAGAAFTTVLSECINFLIQCYQAKKTILADKLLYHKTIISSVSGAVIVLLLCSIFNTFIPGQDAYHALIRVALSGISSLVFYLLFLIITKNEQVSLLIRKRK